MLQGKGLSGFCPVNKDARAKFVENAKKKKAEEEAAAAKTATSAAGGCPVDHETRGKFVEKAKAAGKKAASTEGCDSDAMEEKTAYNVYGEKINPKNMMPNPNQLPLPGQSKKLSVERAKVRQSDDIPLPSLAVFVCCACVWAGADDLLFNLHSLPRQSSIPKSGTDGTWTYPSPQMFFNSLNRKGKAEDVTEDDMDVIVSIHNNMNEKAWFEVEEWELIMHQKKPKLMKFMGRPHDFSPKARMYQMMGWVHTRSCYPSRIHSF